MSAVGSHFALTSRRAWALLIGTNIIFGLSTVGLTGAMLASEAQWRDFASAVVAGVVMVWLNLWHSFAAARSVRPTGWMLTGLAMVVISVVPPYSLQWSLTGWFVSASALMLLPRWFAVAVVGACLLYMAWPYPQAEVPLPILASPVAVVGYKVYAVVIFLAGVGGLYWPTRLVQLTTRLHRTRLTLAEAAAHGERRRILRDLHDLLGQSLSTVSVKGDLALRLLRYRRPEYREELAGIVAAAETALQDVRALPEGGRDLSLQEELDNAAGLLEALGIQVDLRITLSTMSRNAEAFLAWAVREGTTNVIRHSRARRCVITVQAREATVHLEMANDGVDRPVGHGTGLTGLADRAAAVGAAVSWQTEGGAFVLRADVPNPLT